MNDISSLKTIKEIQNISLTDKIVEDIFKKVLIDDIENVDTFIDIFNKIIHDENISKKEMELLWNVWSLSFYKKIISNVLFEWKEKEVQELIPFANKKINKLFKEFNVKTTKSSINWILEERSSDNEWDKQNEEIEIKSNNYLKFWDIYYKILKTFWDYFLVKNLDENNNLNNLTLIDSKWKILIKDKRDILEPFIIWSNVFLKWLDDDWVWLSIYKENIEKVILSWKVNILKPNLIDNKIFCKWLDSYWEWLSNISWDKEIVLLENCESIWKTIFIDGNIFCKKTTTWYEWLSEISSDTEKPIIIWKKSVWLPFLLNGRIFSHRENSDWKWLSEIKNNKQNTYLSWKELIWNPFSVWNQLFCEWSDKDWKWLSNISWKQEIICLSWKETIKKPFLIWNQLFCEWTDENWKWLSNISW